METPMNIESYSEVSSEHSYIKGHLENLGYNDYKVVSLKEYLSIVFKSLFQSQNRNV